MSARVVVTFRLALGTDTMADRYHVAEAIREAVSHIEQGQYSGTVKDEQGNAVGKFTAQGLSE